mmetsp:Transcript_14231/g.19834  ORF Transcript_14231/g.19834 Transcript_14231/m.19834 type:complete len:109 (+) Transcript_14231:29-355(+)
MDSQTTDLAIQYYKDTFFEDPWQELEQQASNLPSTSNHSQTVLAYYSDNFFEDPWKDIMNSSTENSTSYQSQENQQQYKPYYQNRRGKPNNYQRGRGGYQRGNWQKRQ